MIDTILQNNHLPEILFMLALAVAFLTLPASFVSSRNSSLRTGLLIFISSFFFLNILLIDTLFIEGLEFSKELFVLGKFSIALKVEPMGLIFLNMLGLLWVFALLYTTNFLRINEFKKTSRFLFFLNACIICGVMIALSGNLFTMFVFYEMLTICTIPLIAHKTSKKVKHGLFKYLTILMVSSLVLFLPALIIVYGKIGHGNFEAGGIMIYSGLSAFYSKMLLLMFIFGIAKSALFPLHGWLPSAMVASYPVSALLHAVVVVKTGLFCIYKVLSYIFGMHFLQELFADFNWLIIIPILTIIYSSFQAIRYKKVKMILAYSTINQLSIAILSAFLLTPKGIAAALLHMVSHSFTKITLFYCAGSIYSVRHSHNVSELKGAAYFMPKVSFMFLIAGLSLMGIPPLAGFISKFYIMLAAAEVGNIVAMVVIAISTLFSAIYMLKMLIFIYHPSGKTSYINLQFIRNEFFDDGSSESDSEDDSKTNSKVDKNSNGTISEDSSDLKRIRQRIKLPKSMLASMMLCSFSVVFFIFIQKSIYKSLLYIV